MIGKINMMARKSDFAVVKWWKDEAHKYPLSDLFSLNTLKRKEFTIPLSYNNYDTRQEYGHSHSGE